MVIFPVSQGLKLIVNINSIKINGNNLQGKCQHWLDFCVKLTVLLSKNTLRIRYAP